MKSFSHSLICAVLALLLFPAYSFSEAAENKYEVKSIAVVDLKKIMDQSLAAKTAQKEINTIKDKYFSQIKSQDEALQKRQKELLEQKKALSAEAFGKKVEEFKKKIEQERMNAAKKQKIIEAAFGKSLELIKNETVKVVKEIAAEKKLDMVVPTSQLLYGKSTLDISDEVLKRLNKRLTKVNINIKGE